LLRNWSEQQKEHLLALGWDGQGYLICQADVIEDTITGIHFRPVTLLTFWWMFLTGKKQFICWCVLSGIYDIYYCA